MSEKTDIKSMDLEELKTFFSDMGEKAFRAKQVYEWLHVRQVESFEEMTNLSKTLRERLDETCRIITLRKEQVQISKLDGTRKYLFLLEDGNVIESVLMKYKHGNSVCIVHWKRCDCTFGLIKVQIFHDRFCICFNVFVTLTYKFRAAG